MIDSTGHEGFKKLVKDRDYAGIRYYLCAIIRDDPTFKTSEYEEAEKYLFENGRRIFISRMQRFRENRVIRIDLNGTMDIF